MDTVNLDKYLRMPTENEIRRDNTLPAESTWEMWRTFPASGGILVAKQDRYREVPYHRHPWFELVYMYDGSETILIEGQEITLQKGQSLLINRGVTHFCRACGESDILLNFLITEGYLTQNFFNRFSEESYLSRFFINALNNRTETDHYVFFSSEESRRLPVFIREFLCEYYDKSLYSDDYLDSLMTLILLELANVFRRDMNLGNGKKGREHIIPILRYIEENYSTCTLKTTAEFFNMNSNYLSNYIKQETGMTFTQLVQDQRLRYAANLLRNTGIPVTEAANMAGYENVSFFYKKFAGKYHCSPKEYRENF